MDLPFTVSSPSSFFFCVILFLPLNFFFFLTARVFHKYSISFGSLLSLPAHRNSQTLPHLQESLDGPVEIPPRPELPE